jgi:hypothetical protein
MPSPDTMSIVGPTPVCRQTRARDGRWSVDCFAGAAARAEHVEPRRAGNQRGPDRRRPALDYGLSLGACTLSPAACLAAAMTSPRVRTPMVGCPSVLRGLLSSDAFPNARLHVCLLRANIAPTLDTAFDAALASQT